MLPFSLIWKNSNASKLNLSFLLEKPAGKDGFVKIKNGYFVKPNEERFRIWGVPGAYGIAMDPVKMAGMAAYGLIFLRNDLKLATSSV